MRSRRDDPVTTEYTIRPARRSDVETLIAFTLAEAREAEGAQLELQGATRGVEAAFDTPPAATYWVAEDPDGAVVASTSIVKEWSNFYGGYYWWIQSLFVSPSHRGHGIAERLLTHVMSEASANDALDLRLYAHESNERALRVYRRCDFTIAPYVILAHRSRR